MSISNEQLFPINYASEIEGGEPLSPAEIKFFETISTEFLLWAARDIFSNQNFLNPISVKLLKENPQKIFYICFIRSASVYFLFNALELKIKKDISEGIISDELAQGINRFKGQILHAASSIINPEYLPDINFRNVNDIVSAMPIPLEVKQYAITFLRKSERDLKREYGNSKVLLDIDIFSQLAAGCLTYSTPVFGALSPHDFMGRVFKALKTNNLFKDLPEIDYTSALNAIVARIEEHENRLLEIEAAKRADIVKQHAEDRQKLEDRLKAREQAEAQKRAVAAQERHAAFMAAPQAYELDQDALKIWAQIQNFASSTAKDAKNASLLVSAISQVEQKVNNIGGVPFDIRHDGIKELCDVLLSAPNLLQAARAYSADNNLRQAKIIIPNINENGEYFRGLYHSSDAISQTVNALLQSNDGIVLLASLLLPQSTCKAYASSLRANLSYHKTLQKKIEAFEAQIEGLDGDEEALMRDVLQQDENYQALLAKRNHTLIDKNCEALGFQIRQVLQGRAAKKVASANFVAADEEHEKDKKLPVGWSLDSGEDIAVKTHPDDNQHILIYSTDYPFIQRTIKRKASGTAFEKTIEEVRAQCTQYAANEELMKPLIKEEGFKITSQGNSKVISHPEYAISIPFHRDENSETRQLLDAIALCAERKLQQESIFRTAIECGIAIHQDVQTRAITLSHPDNNLGTITIAPRGYLAKDDFDTIEAWIARVSVQPETTQTQEVIEEEHAEANHEAWKPEESQTFVIFDATTLSRLSSSRDNGRTWLDIIKQTAKLPNVKVVIPSVIAFWEMQGKIPLFDAQGKISGFEQVNSNYSHSGHFLHHIASETENFLQAASIVHINADGTTHVAQEGISKNIVVMQTDGDKALYDRIREIHAKSDSYNILNSRLDAEIYGKDEGENSISRILKEVPFGCAALVVSDDLKFLRDKLPFQTGQKKPVSAAGTNTYIDAALAADAFGLQKKLGLRTVPTLSAIGGQIAAFQAEHRAERGKLFMATHSGRGGGDGIKPGKSVYEIIAAGVKKTKNMWAIRTIRPAASQVIAL